MLSTEYNSTQTLEWYNKAKDMTLAVHITLVCSIEMIPTYVDMCTIMVEARDYYVPLMYLPTYLSH